MSHVKVSFDEPEYSADIDGLGTLRLLEAIRILGLENKTKIYQASTSELYGNVQEVPQTESTPFYPRSPYAVAKLYAYWITVNYREAYNIFASNGILFNHESPLRGETFVTRKITRAAAKISMGLDNILYLGNLDSKRDWGHAKDYVELMWKILQYEKADDWVIATGITTSVRDFVKMSFSCVGIDIVFENEGINEVGRIGKLHKNISGLSVGDILIKVDPKYFRPTEVDLLIGDATKARSLLNWEPTYTVSELCEEMVLADVKLFEKESFLKNAGYTIKNEFE